MRTTMERRDFLKAAGAGLLAGAALGTNAPLAHAASPTPTPMQARHRGLW